MNTDTPDDGPSGTVVRCFADARGATRAIDALRAAGFRAEAIGVLARKVGEESEIARATQTRPIEAAQAGTVTGRLLGGGGGMMIGLTAAVLPGIGPLVGVATMVVTGLLGAGAGGVAGALLGALGAVGVPRHDARRFRECFMHGEVLVVVDAGDRQVEAERILEEEGGKNG
jgi:hypothetical protein